MISMTFTTVIAATIYYYFGYLYTYLNNDMVSLYGVDEGTEYLFIPDKLNNRKLVDIRNNAFMNNQEIFKLDFAGATNLERIGSFAFAYCSYLSDSFSIPSNVVLIETAAFEGCTSLQSVELNATIDTIPNQCFDGCTSLNNIVLNDSIKSIGDYAFADCSSLTYIEIPKSVTEISSVAFQNDSVTLGVYTNSTAHQFAVDNGSEFVLLDAPEPTEPVTEPTEAPTEPASEAFEPTEAVTEQPTEALKLLLGDADGDGMVDVTDATVIQRVLNYIDVSSYNENAADVDRSGEVEIIDATYIMRYSALLTVPYPIGEWI